MTTVPENWRDIWNNRSLIRNFTTHQAAENYITRFQPKYKETLRIDEHPKDGIVVYHDRLTVKEQIAALHLEKLTKLQSIPYYHIAYAIMEEEIDDCKFVLDHLNDREKIIGVMRHTTSGALLRLVEELLHIPSPPVDYSEDEECPYCQSVRLFKNGHDHPELPCPECNNQEA